MLARARHSDNRHASQNGSMRLPLPTPPVAKPRPRPWSSRSPPKAPSADRQHHTRSAPETAKMEQQQITELLARGRIVPLSTPTASTAFFVNKECAAVGLARTYLRQEMVY